MEYFDKVHGGYERFISDRGTYFLKTCGSDKEMFLKRLDKILQVMNVSTRHIDTLPVTQLQASIPLE